MCCSLFPLFLRNCVCYFSTLVIVLRHRHILPVLCGHSSLSDEYILCFFAPKIFKCCSEEEEFPEDLRKDDMRYMQGYTSLLSSAFYWWLNWIFRKGYTNALELSDLGCLSEVHTTKYQRDVFTRALKKEQVGLLKWYNWYTSTCTCTGYMFMFMFRYRWLTCI